MSYSTKEKFPVLNRYVHIEKYYLVWCIIQSSVLYIQISVSLYWKTYLESYSISPVNHPDWSYCLLLIHNYYFLCVSDLPATTEEVHGNIKTRTEYDYDDDDKMIKVSPFSEYLNLFTRKNLWGIVIVQIYVMHKFYLVKIVLNYINTVNLQ